MEKTWIQHVALGVMIALVWALLALPIVFYHLPVSALDVGSSNSKAKEPLFNTSNTSARANSSCSSPVSYTSSVCRDVLQKYTDCLPGNTQGSAIMIAQNKSNLLGTVSSHIEIIKFFAHSEQCRDTAVPMLCLHYLGPLCDAQHRSHRLSKKQCLYLSKDICKKEWELAGSFVDLPDCNGDLFSTNTQLTTSCKLNKTKHTSAKPTVSGNCSLNCSDMFYCQSGRQSCIPSCGWHEYTEPTNTVIDVAVIVAASMGLVFGVLTLISAAVRRQRMCSFPSVIVVYQTLAALAIGLIVLIGYTNKKALFYQSDSLTESMKHSTPFCVISAILTHCLLMNVSLWWLCHTAAIYWKLRFPFQARNLEIENKIKYIHFACGVFTTLASFIPFVAISLVDWRQRVGGESLRGTLGFGITRFPPIVCTGVNRYAVYYSLVFPINLLVPVGVTLLILVLWLIHKNSSLQKATDSQRKLRFLKLSSAQSKLLFVLCYYVIITLVSLTGLTIASREGPAFAKEVVRYFTCELRGYNPSHPCDRSQLDKRHHPGLVSISFIFVGLYPLVNFFFTTNLTEVKDSLVKRCCSREEGEETKTLMDKGWSVKSHGKRSDDEDSTDRD